MDKFKIIYIRCHALHRAKDHVFMYFIYLFCFVFRINTRELNLATLSIDLGVLTGKETVCVAFTLNRNRDDNTMIYGGGDECL